MGVLLSTALSCGQEEDKARGDKRLACLPQHASEPLAATAGFLDDSMKEIGHNGRASRTACPQANGRSNDRPVFLVLAAATITTGIALRTRRDGLIMTDV